MRILERVVFVTGLVVMGATLAYRYVLTNEQRSAAQEAADVVKASVREVTDTITPLVSDGPTKSEEEAMAAENRARTAAQWEALGY